MARKAKTGEERCSICGCLLNRGSRYATPTPEGRSGATEHHFVAERFFGRSNNRRGEQRERLFEECPWGIEGKSAVFCYECHELLLHNPVFLPGDVEAFARLVRERGLDEAEKTGSTDKLAGRVQLLQEVIARGLESCLADGKGRTAPAATAMDISWTGPYAWPRFEAKVGLPPIPGHPGVYLMTVDYRDGYLIYAAGITRRPIPTRFREHTLKYRSGDYTVLDVAAMRRGERVEVWHGWGWTPEKREEFARRRAAILEAAGRQMEGFRIFAADVGSQPRVLERIEAAIMDCLYRQPPPFSSLPDKGMMLAPRWDSEAAIVVRNSYTLAIHGLPARLEV
jgi:hypothetical protein